MKYRDLIRELEQDGWRLVRASGSHMMYDHPTKPSPVVVPAGGKLNRDVPAGTLSSIRRQAGIK